MMKQQIKEQQWMIISLPSWILPPYPPAVVVAVLICCVPSNWVINRGYTMWFHLAGLFTILTQSVFMRKVVVQMGWTVVLGWYSAVINDYLFRGRFFELLYRNVGVSIYQHLLDKDELQQQHIQYPTVIAWHPSQDFWTVKAPALFCAHLLDIIAHPLFAYAFWYWHVRQGGKLVDIITWPTILTTYFIARCWSITHTWYNYGSPGLFYIGSHMYISPDSEYCIAAYISEALMYISIIIYKLGFEDNHTSSPRKQSGQPKQQPKKQLDDQKLQIEPVPMLIPSPSSLSEPSTDE